MTNNRYTAYIKWPELGEFEEIDVDALNEAEARRMVLEELQADYLPGYQIIACERRVGMYF